MATLDLQVGAQTDDIYFFWNGSAWVSATDNSSILVGCEAPAYKYGCGLRFLNVTIPNAETIVTAYLTIKCPYAKAGTTVNSVIIGEDTDSALTFSTTANYQARRGTIVGGANNNNITTASVNWNAIPAWTADVDYNSPEIKTIIQEIVDRGGWSSGNDLVLFWDDHGDNSTHDTDVRRYGYGYFASSANCAKLHIEYTLPSRSFGIIIG